MKKTMRFFSMAALAMVGMMMTGCSSEDNLAEQQAEVKKNAITLTTTINLGGDEATTRALTVDFNNKKATKTFAEGDQVAVIYKNSENETVKAVSTALQNTDITNNGKTATISVTLNNPTAGCNTRIIYPATMAATSIETSADPLTDAQTLNYTALATQDGTLANLNTHDLATFDGALNGLNLPDDIDLENRMAVMAYTLKNSDGSATLNSSITKMTISSLGFACNINRAASEDPIYIAMPPVAGANINYAAYDGNNYYTKSVTSKTYAASDFYNSSLRMTTSLSRITGANSATVLAGDYTTITADDATTLAKQCWGFAGGTVYVVYKIENYQIYYVMTSDGSTTTNTSISVMNAASLMAEGSTAWRVPIAAAPSYKMAANATADDKGKLICTAGHIHPAGGDAACTAGRVAKIIYVGTNGHATYNHGLALALEDMSTTLTWDNSNNDGKTAAEWCSAWNTSTPVTDAEWLLASKDQWDYMLGTDGAGSYTTLRDGFTSVGGSNLQLDGYWSSTEYDSDAAWFYDFDRCDCGSYGKDYDFPVRACLAF